MSATHSQTPDPRYTVLVCAHCKGRWTWVRNQPHQRPGPRYCSRCRLLRHRIQGYRSAARRLEAAEAGYERRRGRHEP